MSECPSPGVYYDIPAHLYHKWPAISSTLLKAYAKLPSTCRIPFIPGDDVNVGSGIHAYSLQGQAGLDAECFILPMSCEGKSAKALAERECHQAANPGKVLLPPVYGSEKVPMMGVLKGVDDSLRSHITTAPIMAKSKKEVSLVWVDAYSGLMCKARLDLWDGHIIWDLKKSRTVDGIQYELDKGLHYRIQAGHYMNGAVACGLNPIAFGFISIEAFPPYQVAPIYSDTEKTEIAQRNAELLIGLVKQSQLKDVWPNDFIPKVNGPYYPACLSEITPDSLIRVY
jgi:hypothetical protein